MEYIDESKDTVENANIFMDLVSKTLEGLKDKIRISLCEGELKNEKPEVFMIEWVNDTLNIIKEKFEQVYGIKYKKDYFNVSFKKWVIKFKDNQDFLMNAKVFYKILNYTRTTIKSKISESDSLSNVSLTDLLINKVNSEND